ncbi:MAG: hypothetical protein FWC51_00435 [Proteobacteria bacterium]|nr:hypothetical protein [Pseudomonadota bacterium]
MGNVMDRFFDYLNNTGQYWDAPAIYSVVTGPLDTIAKLSVEYQSRQGIFKNYPDQMRNSRAGFELFAKNLKSLHETAAACAQNVDTVKKRGSWFGLFCVSKEVVTLSDMIRYRSLALPAICKGLENGTPDFGLAMSETVFEGNMKWVVCGADIVNAMNANAKKLRAAFEKSYTDALESLNRVNSQMGMTTGNQLFNNSLVV